MEQKDKTDYYRVYVIERKGKGKAVSSIRLWGEFITPFSALMQIEYNGVKDAYVVDKDGNVIGYDDI